MQTRTNITVHFVAIFLSYSLGLVLFRFDLAAARRGHVGLTYYTMRFCFIYASAWIACKWDVLSSRWVRKKERP